MTKTITEKKNFQYNMITNTYTINNKVVSQDEWEKTKSTWDVACSYNHLKWYIDKHGFTNSDYDRSNPNIINCTYTTVQ